MTKSNSWQDDSRKTIGKWFSLPLIWKVPVYQRHYAWNAKDASGPIHLFWGTMQEQAEKRLEGKTPSQHYLGAVLVKNKSEGSGTPTETKDYDVVDGQQRLTTIQVAMLALIQVANKCDCGDEIKEKLKQYVFSGSDRKPKLDPTNFDKEQFQTVLFNAYGILPAVGERGISEENANKSKVVATFNFFKEVFKDFVEEHHDSKPDKVIHALMDALINGFEIVLIVLKPSDDAQKIFESLNSYAEPLSIFDLIRNNVFDRAGDGAEKLFTWSVWQKLEETYWEENAEKKTKHNEAYLARMLVSRTRKTFRFNRNEIFKAYKDFSQQFVNDSSPDENSPSININEEIKELVRYADAYRFLDSNTGRNPISTEFDFGVFRYDVWKNRDFYPAIFSIVGSNVSEEEKRRMINLIESYVIRRGVCNLTTAHYNKQALYICQALGENPDYKGLSQFLNRSEADSQVFPDDERVLSETITAKFYKSVFQRYVFEKIELSMNSPYVERVVVEKGELTIDHILPQGWERNEDWKKIVLGGVSGQNDVAALTVETYINTIGNLTLMSSKNNSIKSNRPLDAVKKLLDESTVKLNRELANEKEWNVEKIAARSRKLGMKVCEIWPRNINLLIK